MLSVATPIPSQAQASRGWPQGIWEGTFTGSGGGAGATRDGSGSGEIASTGNFLVTVDETGTGQGSYLYEWVGRGSGSNNLGDSDTGSLDVSESGRIIVSGDIATLERESGWATVIADSYGQVAAGPLAAVDTPTTLTYIGCDMVEGTFEQNLAGIDEALGLLFRTSIATESFVAFPVAAVGDRSFFDEEVLRIINARLDDLVVRANEANTEADVLAITDEALASIDDLEYSDWERSLDGLPCSSLDFRLGVGDRLADIAVGLLETDVLTISQLEWISHLAMRSGTASDPLVFGLMQSHIGDLRTLDLPPSQALRLDVLDAMWTGASA